MLENPMQYWKVVRTLQYLVLTRLDIVYSVSKLSQLLEKSTEIHWSVVKRTLRYLSGM